jgi:hypothetical protein
MKTLANHSGRNKKLSENKNQKLWNFRPPTKFVEAMMELFGVSESDLPKTEILKTAIWFSYPEKFPEGVAYDPEVRAKLLGDRAAANSATVSPEAQKHQAKAEGALKKNPQPRRESLPRGTQGRRRGK